MGVKKIYIEGGEDLNQWSDHNRREIVDCLYDNIFEFVKNEDVRKVVLTVMTRPVEGNNSRYRFNGVKYDFLLIRDDIEETIYSLIEHLEGYEEYEKCADLMKLCEKYNFKPRSNNDTT